MSEPKGTSQRQLTVLAGLFLLIALVLTYLPLSVLSGEKVLFGQDHLTLHEYRMDYARRALAAGEGLPAWYTAEMLGQPFWSNIQSFPWNPAHLVLLLLDPTFAYTLGIVLSGCLLGGLTFIYARMTGQTRLGSILAGYSIACCGYFTSRVNTGHLHLLESLFCLPLLLLLQEWYIRRDQAGKSPRLPMACLALGALVTVLNGHPQMPFYFMVAAGIYPLFRMKRHHWLRMWGALGFGAGLAFFVWWPMLLLVKRSFRTLPLTESPNDVTFPVGRVLSIFIPWLQGKPFGAENRADFVYRDAMPVYSESIAFIGLLPLLALLFLGVLVLLRRTRVTNLGWYFSLIGLVSLLAALPWIREVSLPLDLVVFRSPSRQVFITLFSLALALGWAATLMTRLLKDRHVARLTLPWLLLIIQIVQLAAFGRYFTRLRAPERVSAPALAEVLKDLPPGGRVSMYIYFAFPENRRIDDVGFFDSVMLADSYTAMLKAGKAPPDYHTQRLNSGLLLPAEALREFGVHYVIDRKPHPQLTTQRRTPAFTISRVEDPRPRATFLADGAAASKQTGDFVVYQRPEADRMVLTVNTPADGWLIIRESHDIGWSATLNGTPAPVHRDESRNFMRVQVPSGKTVVELTYSTPGATVGLILSLISALSLSAFMLVFGKPPPERGDSSP